MSIMAADGKLLTTSLSKLATSCDKGIMLIAYHWGSDAGRDLDTSTWITSPGGIDTAVGYCGDHVGTKYIRWHGDNTGSGYEYVSIYIDAITEDFPAETSISVRTGAWWWGEKKSGDINVTVSAAGNSITRGKNVSLQQSGCPQTGNGLGTATLDLTTGNITY